MLFFCFCWYCCKILYVSSNLSYLSTFPVQIQALEENLIKAKAENNNRLIPFNSVILSLEGELKEVRAQVQQKVESYKELLCLKMKLEKEIKDYNELMQSITADPERTSMP
ncbi:hypothetical protein XENOCAPTIV_021377 [Xenoophorus captivus]|uniref:IF rod domain-containing protein n=1 Tax=Xenoophorus captivus TaxID=1517983 RepID=A0ABV0SGI8_9TELE